VLELPERYLIRTYLTVTFSFLVFGFDFGTGIWLSHLGPFAEHTGTSLADKMSFFKAQDT